MRLSQILRAPDAESGGSPLADEFVTVTRAELDELKAMAERGHPSAPASDAPATEREDFAETWKSREAAFSREIAAGERKAAELERAYKSALRDRELATALVGKSLVAGAASQLIKLWRDDFEVVDEDGEIRILARDGRGVEQAVAERLAGPEFAHFCLPSSRGGTGARGQNRSASPAPPPAGPRTLGEAVVMQWREAASRSEGPPSPAGWGRRR
jgi:hypothetical protein